jgi:cytochrome c oxidase cbb3-type subunit III
MSAFWSIFIGVLVVFNVAFCAWLMTWTSRVDPGEGETTGHRWDGDIVEGNNPLPRWWLGLFWLTIVFSALYLIAYPGLGAFAGLLGWTQTGQYEEEVARAEETYGAIFAGYAGVPIEGLAENRAARGAGRNLFANNCAACHGSDARGARGFPNLTDAEWQWGGEPQNIEATILNGRTGIMPPFGAALDDASLDALTDYVMHLGGVEMDAARASAGANQFAIYCAACHGAEGQGGPFVGAPPLANGTWLYGSGRAVIRDVIANGRTNTMPAQGPLLGPDRVHVLAAYVYGLSHGDERDDERGGDD